MRDLLERYSAPYRFLDPTAADGQAMLDELSLAGETKPMLALPDGRFLVDPTNQVAADALGDAADLSDSTFDVGVVGAGPAGLAAAVYATSEGLRTLVVEREAIGGQAGTTSRIRNYLGFPGGVTGSDLASRAYEQALHFGAHFHLMRESVRLRPGFPWHEVDLSDGETVRAGAVVVATGVTYCRLGVPSLERLVGRGVFYGPAVSEAPAMAGQPVPSSVAGAPPTRPRSTCPATPPRSRCWSGVTPSPPACPTTSSVRSRRHPTSTSASGPRRWRALATAGWRSCWFATPAPALPNGWLTEACSCSSATGRAPTGCRQRLNAPRTPTCSPAPTCLNPVGDVGRCLA